MDFIKKLQNIADASRVLAEDMESMVDARKGGVEKKASRKSLEPITILRKDTEELKKVKSRDPDVQFVLDRMKDIFGG